MSVIRVDYAADFSLPFPPFQSLESKDLNLDTHTNVTNDGFLPFIFSINNSSDDCSTVNTDILFTYSIVSRPVIVYKALYICE